MGSPHVYCGHEPNHGSVLRRSKPLDIDSYGNQVFQLAGDDVRGPIQFASPMLFASGFLSMFLIGGLTGIMLAVAPFDFQLYR